VNKIKGNFGSQSSADEVMVQATVDEADKVDCYVYKTCFFKLPVGCQPTAVTKTEKANPLETVSCP
jgi:hypothetical protein